MKVTVAICTWNRAKLLDQTLSEMHRLEVPAGTEWELLVVNNNCTDGTDAVIAHHNAHLPIRRLFEPKPGQSNARNRAIAAASGELILWTDDDVLVDADWLLEYVQAAKQRGDISFFGGKILPWFEGTPPRWLRAVWDKVACAYATRDLGVEPVSFRHDLVPFGANFAVRADVQRRYPYDPDLGLKPNSSLRGDETTILRAMLNDGLKGLWVPRAAVRHYIPRERQTVAYLRRYFSGLGTCQARTGTKTRLPTLLGKPRWLVRRAIEAELAYRVTRVFCQPDRWVQALKTSSWLWGQLRA